MILRVIGIMLGFAVLIDVRLEGADVMKHFS